MDAEASEVNMLPVPYGKPVMDSSKSPSKNTTLSGLLFTDQKAYSNLLYV